MMSKIFKFFNIDLQPHQGLLALTTFICLVMHSYNAPIICKTAISQLPPQWLSFETVWCCIASLIAGMLWKGSFRKKVIKWFALFASVESLAGFLLGMWLAFVGWNVWVYSIFSLTYISVVSFFITKCAMAFKSKLWNEKSREKFDNTDTIIRNLGLLIGGILAILACPSLKVALVIYGIGCVIDDIGWIVLYLKLRDKLKED